MAANLANLAVSANDSSSPKDANGALALISVGAAHKPRRALRRHWGKTMFVYFIISYLPKGTYPLKMVNGLWLWSVCAALSYLIKYLQPLIGPSGSRPGG